MKKITITTIVLTAVALLCGVLIGLAHFVTSPIIQKNEDARAAAVYAEYFEDLARVETAKDFEKGKYVYDILVVYGEGNKVVGFIFKGKDVNGFGLVDIIVVADAEGKIIGTRVLTNENTPGISDVHFDDNGNILGVKGDQVNELNGLVDAKQGASVTGSTLVAILNEVKELAPLYMDVEVVPSETTPTETVTEEDSVYVEMFGEGAVATNDILFITTEEVTKKEIVKDAEGNLLGYAYTATGNADTDIPGKGKGSITLLVGVDLDGKIKGVYTTELNHTPGFYNKYNEALENLAGVDMPDAEVDIDTTASISGRLINELLNAIKQAIIDENKTLFEKIFGDDVVAEVDETFETTELITKKEVIKDKEGAAVGYAYTATGEADTNIPGKGKETITLLVVIDLVGNVKGVITLESNHTPGFYNKYNEKLENLTGVDVSNLEVDIDTTASISGRLINELLNAIRHQEAK